MKKSTPVIDIAQTAKHDTRCDDMAQALLTKNRDGKKSKSWPAVFQATGGKAGSKSR